MDSGHCGKVALDAVMDYLAMMIPKLRSLIAALSCTVRCAQPKKPYSGGNEDSDQLLMIDKCSTISWPFLHV